METIEIPAARWPQTLAEFSAVHEGWLVSLDILEPSIGAQPEVEDLPLVGIVAEPDRTGGLITISTARADGAQMTHAIHKPEHVWIERTHDGADAALQVEAADGTRTILRLKTAARPETVDGMPRE